MRMVKLSFRPRTLNLPAWTASTGWGACRTGGGFRVVGADGAGVEGAGGAGRVGAGDGLWVGVGGAELMLLVPAPAAAACAHV